MRIGFNEFFLFFFNCSDLFCSFSLYIDDEFELISLAKSYFNNLFVSNNGLCAYTLSKFHFVVLQKRVNLCYLSYELLSGTEQSTNFFVIDMLLGSINNAKVSYKTRLYLIGQVFISSWWLLEKVMSNFSELSSIIGYKELNDFFYNYYSGSFEDIDFFYFYKFINFFSLLILKNSYLFITFFAFLKIFFFKFIIYNIYMYISLLIIYVFVLVKYMIYSYIFEKYNIIDKVIKGYLIFYRKYFFYWVKFFWIFEYDNFAKYLKYDHLSYLNDLNEFNLNLFYISRKGINLNYKIFDLIKINKIMFFFRAYLLLLILKSVFFYSKKVVFEFLFFFKNKILLKGLFLIYNNEDLKKIQTIVEDKTSNLEEDEGVRWYEVDWEEIYDRIDYDIDESNFFKDYYLAYYFFKYYYYNEESLLSTYEQKEKELSDKQELNYTIWRVILTPWEFWLKFGGTKKSIKKSRTLDEKERDMLIEYFLKNTKEIDRFDVYYHEFNFFFKFFSIYYFFSNKWIYYNNIFNIDKKYILFFFINFSKEREKFLFFMKFKVILLMKQLQKNLLYYLNFFNLFFYYYFVVIFVFIIFYKNNIIFMLLKIARFFLFLYIKNFWKKNMFIRLYIRKIFFLFYLININRLFFFFKKMYLFFFRKIYFFFILIFFNRLLIVVYLLFLLFLLLNIDFFNILYDTSTVVSIKFIFFLKICILNCFNIFLLFIKVITNSYFLFMYGKLKLSYSFDLLRDYKLFNYTFLHWKDMRIIKKNLEYYLFMFYQIINNPLNLFKFKKIHWKWKGSKRAKRLYKIIVYLWLYYLPKKTRFIISNSFFLMNNYTHLFLKWVWTYSNYFFVKNIKKFYFFLYFFSKSYKAYIYIFILYKYFIFFFRSLFLLGLYLVGEGNMLLNIIIGINDLVIYYLKNFIFFLKKLFFFLKICIYLIYILLIDILNIYISIISIFFNIIHTIIFTINNLILYDVYMYIYYMYTKLVFNLNKIFELYSMHFNWNRWQTNFRRKLESSSLLIRKHRIIKNYFLKKKAYLVDWYILEKYLFYINIFREELIIFRTLGVKYIYNINIYVFMIFYYVLLLIGFSFIFSILSLNFNEMLKNKKLDAYNIFYSWSRINIENMDKLTILEHNYLSEKIWLEVNFLLQEQVNDKNDKEKKHSGKIKDYEDEKKELRKKDWKFKEKWKFIILKERNKKLVINYIGIFLYTMWRYDFLEKEVKIMYDINVRGIRNRYNNLYNLNFMMPFNYYYRHENLEWIYAYKKKSIFWEKIVMPYLNTHITGRNIFFLTKKQIKELYLCYNFLFFLRGNSIVDAMFTINEFNAKMGGMIIHENKKMANYLVDTYNSFINTTVRFCPAVYELNTRVFFKINKFFEYISNVEKDYLNNLINFNLYTHNDNYAKVNTEMDFDVVKNKLMEFYERREFYSEMDLEETDYTDVKTRRKLQKILKGSYIKIYSTNQREPYKSLWLNNGDTLKYQITFMLIIVIIYLHVLFIFSKQFTRKYYRLHTKKIYYMYILIMTLIKYLNIKYLIYIFTYYKIVSIKKMVKKMRLLRRRKRRYFSLSIQNIKKLIWEGNISIKNLYYFWFSFMIINVTYFDLFFYINLPLLIDLFFIFILYFSITIIMYMVIVRKLVKKQKEI